MKLGRYELGLGDSLPERSVAVPCVAIVAPRAKTVFVDLELYASFAVTSFRIGDYDVRLCN